MAKGQRGFEEAGRLLELASGAVEIRGTPGGDNSTVRVIECLGDADPFLSKSDSVVELS
jgi:hypothetical protein